MFILGAGFSRAISENMPLLSELSQIVEASLGKEVEKLAFSPFFSRRGSVQPDFELAMTFLSQRHPWLTEDDYLANKSLSLKIAKAIGDTIEGRTDSIIKRPCPRWLKRIVHLMHAWRSSIITLNYDTLLESAFSLIHTGEKLTGISTYAREYLDATALYPINFRNEKSSAGLFSTSELLKLHGSTNWLYSGRTSFLGESFELIPVESWSDQNPQNSIARSRHWRYKTSRQPLIVPPVADKIGHFENEDMRHLWAKAATALRQAGRVFCIGYSLPQTDLTMRFLLHGSMSQSRARLYIVNKDIGVVERYEMLDTEIETKYIDESGKAIERLCDDLATEHLEGPAVNHRAGAGKVERACRAALRVGCNIVTPPWNEECKVVVISESGIGLSLGSDEIPLHLTWTTMEGIYEFVHQELRAKPPVNLKISGRAPSLLPPTIEDYLAQTGLNRAFGHVFAALLVSAGLATMPDGPSIPQDRVTLLAQT